MKKLLFACLILLTWFFSPIAMSKEGLQKVTVTKVQDGDSIKMRLSINGVKARLSGIDCYETSAIPRAYRQAEAEGISIEEVVSKGEKAKEILAGIIEKNKNKLYFEFQGMDKYNRILGVLYCADKSINDIMLKSGYCPKY